MQGVEVSAVAVKALRLSSKQERAVGSILAMLLLDRIYVKERFQTVKATMVKGRGGGGKEERGKGGGGEGRRGRKGSSIIILLKPKSKPS